ncbi:MAG: cupin domain-containing protein [Ruminococcaceae bacterium]|nr:cupin domain-containing protein [Oscillospiraceae bacterium]
MNRYSNKKERAERLVNFQREKTVRGKMGMAEAGQAGQRRLDRGPLPVSINLEAKAIENENYLNVLWTGAHMQLTVMSIDVGSEIPMEVHEGEEQLIYIERGEAEIIVMSSENKAELSEKLKSGYCAVIPSSKHHRVKNIGDRELKLFSVYAPPVHMRGTVQR